MISIDGWIAPQWPAPPNVRAICTTRAGGVSAPPYDTLNLGDHVADNPRAVASNRTIFARAIEAKPVFLRQIHGHFVIGLDQSTSDASEADGCITAQPGIACTIMVADCLPVLFTTASGNAVAAAHAGWRGLAGEGGIGILENTVKALLNQSKANASDVMAWLGPCIGPTAFEVGAEVKAAFVSEDESAAAHFCPYGEGKWRADLQGLARLRLEKLGITRIHGNDGSAAWCTVMNASKFFSHRRDRVSGRFAVAVWLG